MGPLRLEKDTVITLAGGAAPGYHGALTLISVTCCYCISLSMLCCVEKLMLMVLFVVYGFCTSADGDRKTALLNTPSGLCISHDGRTLFIGSVSTQCYYSSLSFGLGVVACHNM